MRIKYEYEPGGFPWVVRDMDCGYYSVGKFIGCALTPWGARFIARRYRRHMAKKDRMNAKISRYNDCACK